ncbi:uroporphyrinogen-III C-methyltransferase [Kingella negevensis]|uniref:Putative uroporphyrinogen-III C-methyltransferase n=1 Tax=Kingella negevensis TaxID=1522312 RepID=A0A238TAB0_9NEIS|nr:uroporphyrinogen-III C-methyltransferase [Kingella negevensis]MDK4683688.1 uroporphyrinogen-III C-methyltransferase [Kingella negevensis]MDK4697722.1 uroporphyrinogen-III C-methyltransferase [Kingella negevensis]MDK4708416.1 uroporphyrinogen-III C-methyltransferase [Kingella negevensis]MDK4710922.1 uroporphyrinogen-III C-methyltransferase [Kingella negevensis]SNB67458.1 Putative uroporphyrinogen-III C-methyltransferase [Kingella negevensis]
MTDSQNKQENQTVPAVTQPEKPLASTAQPQQIVIEKTGGKGMATGALVLSLLALGASGLLFVQGQNTLNTQKLAFEQDLNNAALGNSQNAVLLQNTLAKQDAIDAQITKLLASQESSAKTLNNVNLAYAELLKGRVNWLVDEVEVTLNVASQQLLLSGNVPVATNVLENIERRLQRFEQPELLPIKQAISDDLNGLKSRPYLNITGTALRLERLDSSVDALPLLVDNTLKAENAEVEPVSQAGNFWNRALDGTVALMKSMVEVRKLDNGDQMLLSPEQIYVLRQNLHVRLIDARLALLQNNGDIYKTDLEDVEGAIKQYFDTSAPAAQAMLKELAELKTLEIRRISDDALKNSLAAVRAYQDSVRTSAPVVLPENLMVAPVAPTNTAPASVPAKAASVPAAAAASVPAKAASVPVQAASEAAKPKAASEPKKVEKPAEKPKAEQKQPEKGAKA